MTWLYVLLGALAVLLAVCFGCFFLAFYNPARTEKRLEEERLIPGKIYEPFYPDFERWHRETEAMEREEWSVTTPDGLTLRGRYYPLTPDAPVEILFHGYRGHSARDMCGAVQRCFSVGHSALLVDQRGNGRSDGHVITFGIRESEDVALWAQEAVRRFGEDCTLYIGGVSMGASTVLMAAAQELPPQVKGVLADCGYTNARDIIKKVIKQIGLPANLLYPLVRLGAMVYGGFDPNQADAAAAAANSRLPIIFYHGDTDDFVPCEMSRINYEACTAPKRLVIIPGAGHGLCYPVDPDGYVAALKEFNTQYTEN